MTYSWYKDSIRQILQPEVARTFISRDGRLYLTSVEEKDQGDYYCMIRFPQMDLYQSKVSMPIPLHVISAGINSHSNMLGFSKI